MPLMELGSTQDEIVAAEKVLRDAIAELNRTPATKANTQLRSSLQSTIDYWNANLPGLHQRLITEEAQRLAQQQQPSLQPPAINYGPTSEESKTSTYMMYGLAAVGLLVVYKMFFMKKA